MIQINPKTKHKRQLNGFGEGNISVILCFFSLLFLSKGEGWSKDFGSYGQTFEVIEENLLNRIQEQLAAINESGKMAEHQSTLTKRVNERVMRPVPVEGMTVVSQNSVKEYDPTFILDQDIRDHEGNLIGEKGAQYNPLDYRPFGIPLLFIDGDNDQQVSWSLSQEGKTVLVKGSPISLEKQYQKPFYFDQGGAIAKRLGIDKVPAKVSQDGKKLRIDFVKISEN